MSTTTPNGNPGGATVPGQSPTEMPADNRDPGVEAPMPDGDSVPTPDTTSPTPAPTEVPQTGGAFTGSGKPQGGIDADTIQNGGLGQAMTNDGLSGTSKTEAAMQDATKGA